MPAAPTRFQPRSRLYAIVDTGYVADDAIDQTALSLIAGGAGVIQLRAKHRGQADVHALATRLLPICRDAGVPFIINDYPAIAADLGADGVHIGQDDGSLAAARAIVGPDAIIGRSTHSLDQAVQAGYEGFDYIGFGPLFPTGTKPGRPAIGLADIAAATARVPCPVFCIGGINHDTLPAVLAAGATHLVIVSALLQASDITSTTRAIVARLG
jgi:thiamine-phosphate pyrophosphorylase